MALLQILAYPDPRLRKVAAPVAAVTAEVERLIRDMAQTMYAAPGVGLAAPQLGVALQACVIEVENRLHELVNPRIVKAKGDDRDLEGCLSLPGYVAYVTRREQVWVVAQNRHGKRIKLAGQGLLSRAVQHELAGLTPEQLARKLDLPGIIVPARIKKRCGPRRAADCAWR